MDYKLLTNQYYSRWLGIPEILLNEETSIRFIYSYERNTKQYGYSSQFDIYALCQKDRLIISYGEKAAEKICLVEKAVNLDLGLLIKTIRQVYEKSPNHYIKYCFAEDKGHAISRTLTKDDYSQYLTFFKNNNPGCQNTDWVDEYFDEMTKEHTCCGVFEDDILVSCTDSPGMPYMADKVQEIGINTLPEYRGKGYAADACSLCAQNIILNGKCPQWSTSGDNIASQKLAEKCGFTKLCDVVTLIL